MRTTLVMNPAATTATERTAEVIVKALSAELDVTVARTEYRGHGSELAAAAAARGDDLVIAFGGDGTVNEVTNGLLAPGVDGAPPAGAPLLAVLPGGSTNVFLRALGLPNDPIQATAVLLDALRAGRRRAVSIGQMDERYFTFCAGFGFDAAIVGLVEEQRAAGKRSSGGLYVRSAIREYLTTPGYRLSLLRRRTPPLRLQLPDGTDLDPLYVVLIANTSPWSYLGNRAIHATPQASFETGLDLFGLTSLSMATVMGTSLRLLRGSPRLGEARGELLAHDLSEFTLSADDPMDIQVDGDHLGQRSKITVRNLPGALTVLA
jgi:diacylglycerol kinase family enzyme